MPSTPASDSGRIEQAFSGNRLLATFSKEARGLVESSGTIVDCETGTTVLVPGRDVQFSIFPFAGTTVSLLVTDGGGRTVEVASIGKEGAVGGIVSCGHSPAYSRAEVQVAGPAFRVPLKALEEAKAKSAFIGNLFCRYSDYLLAQVMQSVACNAYHSICQRAARWLLTAQDRAGDRLELTQEVLAGLLGVQRTTLNAVVRAMQDQGLIAIRRGSIQILDTAGIRAVSCQCYEALEGHFDRIIGPTGNGVPADSE